MDRLHYFLIVVIVVLFAFCFVGNHYYRVERDYNIRAIELIERQNDDIEKLFDIIQEQKAIINTYKGIYGGRIEITLRPKEPIVQ